MTSKVFQYVPIDSRGYRIPVAEWPARDLMALDTARLDDEVKNPQDPRQAVTVNKRQEKVAGGTTRRVLHC